MSISHIPVVGTFTYRDADETPAAGEKIHFIAVSPATVDGDVVTLPKKLVCTLNADGEVPDDFTLPTVGDGLYYSVREKFPGGRDDYTIEVLTTDTEIDLATVAPVVPPEDLESTRGPAGPAGPTGPAGPDGDASVSIMTASVDTDDGCLYIDVLTAGGTTPIFAIDSNGNLGVTL